MSSLERMGWTSDPSTRGTLNIIWGSFATLGLCVWTAVHPNINVQLRPNLRRDLGVRLGMMVVAVIFPEILISAAWQQRVAAHDLSTSNGISKRSIYSLWRHKESTACLEKLASTTSCETDTDATNGWGREQAFFVVMGGFAFDHSYTDGSGTEQHLRSVLTVKGFQLMQRNNYAPQFTKADVDERSKADIIAKVVVVTQVTWFAIQVTGRVVAGLAVTALEVHTIVHVGCAIFMYVLWWNKPYAITRSVVLQTDEHKKIGDLFLFQNILCERHKAAVKTNEGERKEYWERRAINGPQGHDHYPEKPQMPTVEEALKRYNVDDTDSSSTDKFEILLRSTAKNAHAGLQLMSDHRPSISSHQDGHDTSPLLDSADIVTPCRSYTATLIDQGKDGWRGVRQTSNNFTLRQVWGSWTMDTGHEITAAKLMHFLFNLLFGAGHLAAWNSSAFPTPTEAWLWRISAAFVASLFTYGSVWILYWMGVRSQRKSLLPIRRGDLNIVMGPFFCSVILIYFCARCYFFAESIISLRSLPPSAYQTVIWANFLPHGG